MLTYKDGQQIYEKFFNCRMLLSTHTVKMSTPERLFYFMELYSNEKIYCNLDIETQFQLPVSTQRDHSSS